MNKKFVLFLSLLLLFPQCGQRNRKKTFQPVKEESKKRINVDPHWTKTPAMLQVATMLEKGITLQDAIILGVNHNPTLQAQFEELGISQADLTQAGFYSNPVLSSAFFIPQKDTVQTEIDLIVSFSLSDLWQVPLRKKVAKDKLEIKKHEIIDNILQLRRTVQQQYITCLYNIEYLELVKEIFLFVQSYKERIDYRYQFGYNSDLDKYLAIARVAEWQAKIIAAEVELHKSYLALRELLGSYVTPEVINFLDKVDILPLTIAKESLENFALSYHSLILLNQAKIDRAQDTISYERSRVLDNVSLGVAYNRDFEKGVAGVGPAFNIDVPIFNTNFGNIERAKFEHKMAEKDLFAQEQIILKNISMHYATYQSYLQQIEIYKKNLVPSAMKAINYGQRFFKRMQLDKIIVLDSQIDLFKTKIDLLDLTYKAAFSYIELELAVGAKLSNIDS
jgi:outer membrane protein, heavy metal efflux system